MKTMTFEDATWILWRRYGTHAKAAKSIGINSAYYSQLRNGRVTLRPLTEQGIIRCAEIASKEIWADNGQ